MEERKWCIYKHTSPNGKAYIGQTKNYKHRCLSHVSASKNENNLKHHLTFQRAIAKYGWDNFKHEILLDNLTLAEANKYEEFYISEHDTLSPNGYNLQLGGNNKKSCPESIEKVRLALTGRKRPPEVIAKMQANKKPRIITDELREKYRICSTGRLHSEETKAKMSAWQIGKVVSEETGNAISFSLQKRQFLKEYPFYLENIKDLPENTIFNARQLCKLCGATPMIISRRANSGVFKNLTRIGLKCQIPIQDIHDYYADGIIKYGE
jgi:group I intron endonuclease